MNLFKLILAFLPWVLFKAISLPHTLFSLKIAITTALVACIVLAVVRIHKGYVVLGGLLFFGYGTVAIVFTENPWVIRHVAILAHGSLAFLGWLSILLRRPLTTVYTRDETDKKYWFQRQFIMRNYRLTALWSCIFTMNMVLSMIKLNHPAPAWIYGMLMLVFISVGIMATLRSVKYRDTRTKQ